MRSSTRGTPTPGTSTAADTSVAAVDANAYEQLAEPGAAGVVVFAPDGSIRHVSPAVRSMMGRGLADRMRRAGDVPIHSDDAPRLSHLLDRAAAMDGVESAVLRLAHTDGHWVWVDTRLRVAADPHDRGPARLMVVLRDVTEERRRLLSHVVAAHEEERVRIANDVHDDTVQTVAAIEIKLGQLRRHLTEPRQLEVADELRDMVRGAVDRLRSLIFELQPPGLHRGGLAGAITAFAQELFADVGTTVRIEAHLDPEPGPETALVVYRIVQEALTNSRRHAGAAGCWVRLSMEEGGVSGTVEDDGVGFDPATVADPRPGHRGMQSMRERAELSGGRVRVSSRPQGGTAVTLWVPR